MAIKKIIWLGCLCLNVCFSTYSQIKILKGAQAHIGNGTIIQNSIIVINQNKITDISQNWSEIQKKWNPADSNIVKLDTSHHIYPGFIAPNCYAGLNEIDAARPTKDFYEVGNLNPNIRTLIAYNTDSKILPTLAFNGILSIQASPSGGIISGSSSVVSTKADNWEDAGIKTDDGIYINWNEIPINAKENQLKNHQDFLNELSHFFEDAISYNNLKNNPIVNLKFEAMKGLWNDKKRLYIRVNSAPAIIEVLNFTKKYNIEFPVIVGGIESYIICKQLRESKVPVILMNIHRLPNKTDENVLLPYQLPKILLDSGINFCIGLQGSWEVRNLPFQAGTAAAYGLTKEQALSSITYNTSKILGCDNQIGSIEIGKLANIIICNGDALDMQTNNLYQAYINGKEIELNDMQQKLYNKYHQKYFQK